MSKQAENLEDTLEESKIIAAMDEVGNPLELPASDIPILELATQGASPKNIANSTGYPLSYVRSFLNREDVQDYLVELKRAMNNILQMKLLDTYQRMLTDRIGILTAEGADFSKLSGKDTLDIMKALQTLTDSIERSNKEDKESNTLIQIYQQLGLNT
jgi:hypothetical protein